MVKIKQKEEVKKIFYVYCPECNREIKGTKESQVKYNLKLHVESCKRNKIEKFIKNANHAQEKKE